MTEVRLTAPPQMMAVLDENTPTPRARGRLAVPKMKPIEETEDVAQTLGHENNEAQGGHR